MIFLICYIIKYALYKISQFIEINIFLVLDYNKSVSFVIREHVPERLYSHCFEYLMDIN